MRKGFKKMMNSFKLFSSSKKDTEVRFGKNEPEETYGFSKNQAAVFKINHSVNFQFVYIKRRNMGESPKKTFIRGYNDEKIVFDIPIEPNDETFNQWKLIYFEDIKEINKLILGPNLSIDNFEFQLDYRKLEKKLEQKNQYEKMYSKTSKKFDKDKNRKDSIIDEYEKKIKKILGDDKDFKFVKIDLNDLKNAENPNEAMNKIFKKLGLGELNQNIDFKKMNGKKFNEVFSNIENNLNKKLDDSLKKLKNIRNELKKTEKKKNSGKNKNYKNVESINYEDEETEKDILDYDDDEDLLNDIVNDDLDDFESFKLIDEPYPGKGKGKAKKII